MVVKFRDYIERLLQLRLTNQHLQHQNFIIGNSSVDYDSFFGSLIYGYMKFLLYNTLFIPLIDCPKQEVPLRFEITYVLNRIGVHHEHLYYHHEFPDLEKRTNVLLYDHNVREGIQPAEIVDHHFMKDKACPRTIVAHCASAMTLLYYSLHPEQLNRNTNEKWFRMYANYGLGHPTTHPEFDGLVDELLRTGILLDSYNFSPKETERWIQEDQSAVQNIEQRLSDRELLSFETLEQIKFDEAMNCNLPLQLILQKDYKEFTYGKFRVAYSIILLPPSTFEHHHTAETIEKHELHYLHERQQSCHFHMFLYQRKDGSYARESTFYSVDEELTGRLGKVLSGLKMERTSRKLASGLEVQHWVDPSSVISRKIVDKEINLKLLSV